MQRKPSITAALFLITLLLFQAFAPILQAQQAPPPPSGQAPPPPTPQELDQLLAPVALYPDTILAQITTASTNPQEILDVDNWLATNKGLTGAALTDAAQQQGFDPAFIALVNFPSVIEMMAENVDDYAAIGEAVSANQAEVAASIQRLRSQAYTSGALRSTPQQQVEVQQSSGQPIYAIQPANPQVVYLPQYDPTVVYAGPSTGDIVASSLLGFGVGIGIGALLVNNQPWGWGGWGWNWGGRSIYYNHGPWGGWHGGYRPPRPYYRPRPVVYGNRPGFGGNWGYRPRNYRPPNNANRPGFSRPGNRPGTRPGTRPGGSNPGNRPGTPGSRPGTPGNRPGGTPGNRPGTPGNRPGGTPGNRPGTPGNRPGGPGGTPGNRPGGNPGTRPGGTPGNGNPGNRPGGNPGNRPGGTPGNGTPGTRPGGTPGTRPSPQPRPTQTRPAGNQHTARPTQQSRPAPQQRPSPRPTANRPPANRPSGGSGSQNRGGNGGKPR
jgi:Protein of unknown function (DUF3300)